MIEDRDARAVEKLNPELGAGSELDLLDALLDAEGLADPRAASLPRRGAKIAPLSEAQRGLIFFHGLDPASHATTLWCAVRLRGTLDAGALKDALSGVARRHEALRTTFVSEGGEPQQIIQDALPVVLERFSGAGGDAGEQAARVAAELARRPWNLAQGPLWRCALSEVSPREHVLIVAMHPLVADGRSMALLLQDISAFYNARRAGAAPVLDDLPIQYADYAAWQHNSRRASERAKELAYWRRLAEAPQGLDLPGSSLLPQALRQGARRRIRLSRELTEGLKSIARHEEATLHMILLAAFQILIARTARQDDFLLGTPVADRNRVELQGLIGLFVNTLILRVDLSGDPTFREHLARVRRTTLEALAHQEVPFEEVVQALRPRRDAGVPPLFQVLFSLQDAPRGELRLAGLDVEEMEIDLPAARLDLTVDLREADGGLTGTLEFDADRLEEGTISRMAGHFRTLLQAIVADPGARLSELPLLTAEENRQLIAWNQTRVSFPESCAHTLFEIQAGRTPEAVAVQTEERRLTYRELNERANQLAHVLMRRGVGPDRIVGIFMERSLEMVISILAIHKAGGAYMPLDPSYPRARLAFMVGDARVPIVVTQTCLLEEHPGLATDVLALDPEYALLEGESRETPMGGALEANLAYVLYTSGSTGAPKGVMISHRSLSNFMQWMTRAFPHTPSDTVLQRISPSFDLSVWEFYAPLISGARLFLAAPGGQVDGGYVIDTVRKHSITTVQFVPSQLALLIEDETLSQCTSLKRVFCGGESIPVELQDRFFALTPAELVNFYGPTETTIAPTTWCCRRGESRKTIPIGSPIANMRGYPLDTHLRPVPVGVPGEMHLAGAGVARGFLGDPALTAERFIPDPFSEEPGGRLYRTGDIVRLLADGTFEFLGRKDHQVKVRGFRIELGEIESVLAEHPEVLKAVVVLLEEDPLRAEGTGFGPVDEASGSGGGAGAASRLVAYLVSRTGEAPSTDALRVFLAGRLPRFMIPSVFQTLAALPMTPNGKVDRRSLPAPDPRVRSARSTRPLTPVESAVADLWHRILGVGGAGPDDDFFELGGHSLQAVRLLAALRRSFRIDLPMTAFYGRTTVETVARALIAHQPEEGHVERAARALARLRSMTPTQARGVLERSRGGSRTL